MKNNENYFLVSKLKIGDETAYISLVDLYGKRLFGYALSLTHDHAQSQDIVQNVFLRTWEKRRKLEIHTSLQNFLYRSVYNEFINQFRKKRATLALEQKYFYSLEKAVLLQEEYCMESLNRKISLEIQLLPHKCQQVFILSKKEGLTNIEISEYLNISVKAVEAQITKAFIILRERIAIKSKTVTPISFGHNIHT